MCLNRKSEATDGKKDAKPVDKGVAERPDAEPVPGKKDRTEYDEGQPPEGVPPHCYGD